MTDKWAEHKQKFCGCKDASRLNRCQGRNNCELPEGHPERVSAAPRQPDGGLPEPDFALDGGAQPCYYAETAQRAIAELGRKVWEWSSAATAEAHRVDELKAERDTLRQQLAELRDMLSGEVEANIPLRQKAFDLTEQRDKLAEILRDIVPGCKWKHMRPRIDAALAEVDKQS